MEIKINSKITKVLGCKDTLDFEANSGYIVNDVLKQYSGPYNDIEKIILKALKQTRVTRAHNLLTHLITADGTYVSSEVNDSYSQISMSGKEIRSRYVTVNSNNDVKNTKGIYKIVNDELKVIYIGETSTSFHIRWTKHYSSPMRQLKTLLDNDNTYFEILEITDGDKINNLSREQYYIDYYKANSDYKVLGGPGF